jgi:dTDP-4-amino-4,6-dideoxygalactose transaminase
MNMGNHYNSWPLGKLPKEFQRPEPAKIKEMGYDWDDPRDIIDIFEKKIAKFAHSNYAVSCDCCTHGIFLALKYLNKINEKIIIPEQTYVSIPWAVKQAGYSFEFKSIEWEGIYGLSPLPVFDGAGRWKEGMFNGGFQVLSFQIKKSLPIGRGGMILLENKNDYDRLKLMCYDGRDLNTPYDNEKHFNGEGYHFYMTPEDAARGIILMDSIPNVLPDSYRSNMYPKLIIENFK